MQFILMRKADADTEGGVMPSEELLGAMADYSVLEVDSLEEATEWAKQWPREDAGGNANLEQAEALFSALSEKGEVTMPFEETFWAHRFGMLTDRFGIQWMISCQTKQCL